MNKILINIINIMNNGNSNLFDAITYNDILNFEQSNNIHLPKDYAKFLCFADGGELYLPAGVQLFGILHKPIIDVHCNDRPDDNYVVIGYLSNGDPILFRKNSEQILIYNIENNVIEDDEIYDDFSSFLEDLKNILGL